MKKAITIVVAIGLGVLTSQAWAGKKEPAAPSTARSQVVEKTPGPSSSNFGNTVSKEAKVFRAEPVPGYRNFGQWVSCQRSHGKNKNCPSAAPTGGTPTGGAPNNVAPPVSQAPAPTDPAVSLAEGSNGT